jgi:hypothetical protein
VFAWQVPGVVHTCSTVCDKRSNAPLCCSASYSSAWTHHRLLALLRLRCCMVCTSLRYGLGYIQGVLLLLLVSCLVMGGRSAGACMGLEWQHFFLENGEGCLLSRASRVGICCWHCTWLACATMVSHRQMTHTSRDDSSSCIPLRSPYPHISSITLVTSWCDSALHVWHAQLGFNLGGVQLAIHSCADGSWWLDHVPFSCWSCSCSSCVLGM